MEIKELNNDDIARLVNNYFSSIGGDSHHEDVKYFQGFTSFIRDLPELKRHKIGVLFICTGENYWPYAKDVIEGAKKFLLPGHQKDFLIWSDMPEEVATQTVEGATLFQTEATTWPLPTLMRYHLFLQQEEKLREYDYLFYCDIDMKFLQIVGDEILGEGITAAVHPMYYLDKRFCPPYEPNKDSTAYIPRPGRVVIENDVPRFQPLYFAGGFQGGTTKNFIEAMKVMRKNIDDDFFRNYTAIWSDESHFNRYLFDNPPAIVLNPSYVYPDSLIKEYYEPIWGRSFTPKLVTLTKPFTISKEGGDALNNTLEQLKPLQKET